MSDDEFQEYLEKDNGYMFVRKLPDDTWVGMVRLITTWGVCIGLDMTGYERRYCYENQVLALLEMSALTSGSDVPKGWVARRLLYG